MAPDTPARAITTRSSARQILTDGDLAQTRFAAERSDRFALIVADLEGKNPALGDQFPARSRMVR